MTKTWSCGVVMCFLAAGCGVQPHAETVSGPSFSAYAVGVREPETVDATDAEIDDAEQVVGVSVGTRHRAYLVSALRMSSGFQLDYGGDDPLTKELGKHVVNDLVNDVPITVTHCDRSSCLRVLTSSSSQSLDIAVGGLKGGKMVLLCNGKHFPQDSDALPVDDYDFEVTTWGEWKAVHSDTDVYVGRL